MKFKKNGELYLGIGILAFGIIYFIISNMLPKKPGVDSSTIPIILGVLIIVLGLLQIAAGYKIKKDFDDTVVLEKYIEDDSDYLTVIKTLGIIGIYIALLKGLGFILSSTIYLFAQMILLTPKHVKRNYIIYCVLSILASVIIYFTFKSGLDLMLPAGILG